MFFQKFVSIFLFDFFVVCSGFNVLKQCEVIVTNNANRINEKTSDVQIESFINQTDLVGINLVDYRKLFQCVASARKMVDSSDSVVFCLNVRNRNGIDDSRNSSNTSPNAIKLWWNKKLKSIQISKKYTPEEKAQQHYQMVKTAVMSLMPEDLRYEIFQKYEFMANKGDFGKRVWPIYHQIILNPENFFPRQPCVIDEEFMMRLFGLSNDESSYLIFLLSDISRFDSEKNNRRQTKYWTRKIYKLAARFESAALIIPIIVLITILLSKIFLKKQPTNNTTNIVQLNITNMIMHVNKPFDGLTIVLLILISAILLLFVVYILIHYNNSSIKTEISKLSRKSASKIKFKSKHVFFTNKIN